MVYGIARCDFAEKHHIVRMHRPATANADTTAGFSSSSQDKTQAEKGKKLTHRARHLAWKSISTSALTLCKSKRNFITGTWLTYASSTIVASVASTSGFQGFGEWRFWWVMASERVATYRFVVRLPSSSVR